MLGCPVANGGVECVRGCGGRYRISDAAMRRAIADGTLDVERVCGTLVEQWRVARMTDEQLQAIRDRLKAATPGPWIPCDGFLDWFVDGVDGPMSIGEDDATFIANAPEDIAALLAEVRRLQYIASAELEAERQAHDASQRRYNELQRQHAQLTREYGVLQFSAKLMSEQLAQLEHHHD